MSHSLFYNHVDKSDNNTEIIENVEEFVNDNPNQQVYLINAPLGEKYTYPYQQNVIVVLSPKHKIIFIDLLGNQELFDIFCQDFIEDLNSLSDKYKYKEHIGRPRDWRNDLIEKVSDIDNFSIGEIFSRCSLSGLLQRKCELLISLLIGSINDIEKVRAEVPEKLLDKVKRNIILFDGDQTRFIYKDFRGKSVSIQGLSGTGKTELLLHKLKELYMANENVKIFFTCHNIALANTLRNRIPGFFNFMKVEKQIEWNSKLWVGWAWGSQRDSNSGLYSYLCNFYKIPFLRWSNNTGYNTIFTQVIEHIDKIEEDAFEYAFDYILIDERQDFPKVFFELCKKVARNKVYIAGDIFQDIFEKAEETELEVDVILNRCYRTDPRTLMFAHAVGMKLFEPKKLNWFPDQYWKAIGYDLKRKEGTREVHLSREPIRRFEDLELENFESVVIKNTTTISNVIKILKGIQEKHPTVTANDIAIIVLDKSKEIYTYMDTLSVAIPEQLDWKVNRAYESKEKIPDSIYITNPNNVKGLEFPFVLCITGVILDSYRYRNILYTMLTRSFIQSYLLVRNSKSLEVFEKGLEEINKSRTIKTLEPTGKEKEEIKNTLVKLQKESNISFKDFLEQIFNDLKIDKKCRSKFERALLQADIEKFNSEMTIKFINANKEFYCE